MNMIGDILFGFSGVSVLFICAADFKSKVLPIILLIAVVAAVLIGSLLDEDDEDDIDDFIDRTK